MTSQTQNLAQSLRNDGAKLAAEGLAYREQGDLHTALEMYEAAADLEILAANLEVPESEEPPLSDAAIELLTIVEEIRQEIGE